MVIAVPAGRRFTWLVLALLAAGIGAAYADSFEVGFELDDVFGVVRNPAIRSLSNIPSFFVDPYALWSDVTQVDLRPFLLITYAVNYAISGLEPWSYHALNLILHFLAAALVFFIVRDHLWWPAADRGPGGAARIPAAVAALFFALAPLNSQPVIYIWARSALLCVTLYLGALLALLRRRSVLGSTLFVLALLTKAIAVTLPVMLLAHDWIYRDRVRYPTVRSYLVDWRRFAPRLVLLGGLSLAYVGYRAVVLPPWTAETRHLAGVTPWIYFVSQWSALLYYVRLFLWPDALAVDHDFPYSALFMPRAWGSLLVLLLWIGFALLARKRHPQVTFATAWYFVTLAPESSFAALGQVINDHRPYVASSLGLSVLLAWVLEQGVVLTAARARQPAFIAACLLLCIPAVGFDRYRTWQWGDTLRIWEDTSQKSPRNPLALINTGIILMTRGDLATARRYFERALQVDPRQPSCCLIIPYAVESFAYTSLSALEAHEGHTEAALRAAEEAARLNPNHTSIQLTLGRALERAGRAGDATAAYRRAIELDPRASEPREALARLTFSGASVEEMAMKTGLDALYVRQDPSAAATEFRRVLELNPTHYGANFQLAIALDRAGKPAEARPVWEKVLKMAEGNKDAKTATWVKNRLARRP